MGFPLSGTLTTLGSAVLFGSVLARPMSRLQRGCAPPRAAAQGQPAAAADPVDVLRDIIVTRRTVGNFEPELPADAEEKVKRALEAAVYAPNHKRNQPWRFYLLGELAIERICQLQSRLVEAKTGKPEAGKKKYDRWKAMPGWLVVTSARVPGDEYTEKENYSAVSCCVQNLLLLLHAEGLGAKWTSGGVNYDPEFENIVGFNSNEEFVVGTIWFGAPAGEAPGAPPKKPLEDLLEEVP